MPGMRFELNMPNGVCWEQPQMIGENDPLVEHFGSHEPVQPVSDEDSLEHRLALRDMWGDRF